MGEFGFQHLTRAEFPLLASWLRRPHVARWWNHEHTAEAVERDFGGSVDGTEPSQNLLALYGGEPVGLVQRSRLSDFPDYLGEIEAITAVPKGAVTIDYLLGDQARTGRGLGARMIGAVVEDTWRAAPDATAVVVPVVASNVVSWRALERAGFHRVGEGNMRPDNPVDDPMHYVYRVDRPPHGSAGVVA